MPSTRFKTTLISCAVAGTGFAFTTPATFAETTVIEEVVVTARKREETLQDISAAVSVVSGDRLLEKGINDVRDLQNIVPSLNIGEVVGLMKINVRGLGNSTNTRGEDQDVVLHVDGAVVARQEIQAMTFFDLDRIEVLRGPQGTLYGRNSTGGTINLITAKPTNEFEGYVNVNVGDYDYFKVDAAMSGPLSDRIRGRAAFQSIDRSGFGKNIGTGNDIDDEHRWAARTHLQFDLSDSVDLLLSGEYATQDDASGFFTYLAPLTPSTVAPGAGGFSDPDSRDGASSFDLQLERKTWSITGTLNWRLNDQWSLRNIANYREMDFFIGQDLDTSTVSNRTGVGIPLNDEQRSEELQLIYQADNFDAIAGLYYFKETFGGETNIDFMPYGGTYYTLLGESETEATALFWNASYSLTEQFALRLGGRYNDEDRSITNDAVLFGNRLTTDSDISDDQRSISKYTGEYGIDFKINENILAYYTFSQGFRSGAALIFQSNSPIIDPTTVDSHELGLKFETADHRFSGSLALFDAKIENLQRTQASTNALGLLVTTVNNVNEMETKGAELELSWIATDQLRLGAAVAYVDAQFKDFATDDTLVDGINVVQVAGNRPRLTPDWKGSLHGEYEFPVANDAVLALSADLTYVGQQYFDEHNRAPFEENAYTLIDTALTYRPASDSWSASLWGKNLGDEKKFADLTFSTFGRVQSKHFINPRTWGVSLNRRF